jgi:hypothetical protein
MKMQTFFFDACGMEGGFFASITIQFRHGMSFERLL